MADKTAILDLKHVEMNFKQGRGYFHALQDINLTAHDGDFICLLGSSGCGKTSLLNIMAGYVRPSEGRVLFNGEDFTRPSSDVGVVFQQQNLFPWLTVYKNVEFGLMRKKLTPKERKEIIMHYLEMVGLEDAAKKYPHQLSGGMRQRATIARTLAPDPRVVLFDEPFSALDALTREKLQEHIKSIWEKSKKSFLFITHDVDEALLLAQRIVVMKAKPGRIHADYANPLLESGVELNSWNIRNTKNYREVRDDIISMIQSEEDIRIGRLVAA
ncbi:MAG: ABC transporter ATP-binding protein [Synergistaceae bacterium]|nr:ABC transporter ATP-binding protein [Synergistaceae bacterium]